MEKMTKASLFHWLWKEEVCVASPHPPFHRLESVTVFCAPARVCVRTHQGCGLGSCGSRLVSPSAFFPGAPGAETDPLCVMQQRHSHGALQ